MSFIVFRSKASPWIKMRYRIIIVSKFTTNRVCQIWLFQYLAQISFQWYALIAKIISLQKGWFKSMTIYTLVFECTYSIGSINFFWSNRLVIQTLHENSDTYATSLLKETRSFVIPDLDKCINRASFWRISLLIALMKLYCVNSPVELHLHIAFYYWLPHGTL